VKRPGRSSKLSELESFVDAALWTVLIASTLLTLFWALGPQPPGGNLFPRADKVLHALAFGVIFATFILAAVWRPGRGWGRFPSSAIPFGAGLLALGVVIELLQGELLGRDADLFDVVAEVVGMAAAAASVRALGWTVDGR
jgi:hypothetical protein